MSILREHSVSPSITGGDGDWLGDGGGGDGFGTGDGGGGDGDGTGDDGGGDGDGTGDDGVGDGGLGSAFLLLQGSRPMDVK